MDALRTRDKAKLSEIVRRRVEWADRVIRECKELDDEHLVGRLEDAYNASKIMEESQDFLHDVNNKALDESLRPLLQTAEAEGLGIATELNGRMHLIASDLYPLVDPADYSRISAQEAGQELHGDDSIAPGLAENQNYYDFFNNLANIQQGIMLQKSEILRRHLNPPAKSSQAAKSSLDVVEEVPEALEEDQPEMAERSNQISNQPQAEEIELEDKAKRKSPTQMKFFDPLTGAPMGNEKKPEMAIANPNTPIGVIRPDGKKELLSIQQTPKGQVSTERLPVTALLNQQAVEMFDFLEEAVDKADPARLALRGSKEYKQMKEALKGCKKAFRALGDPPSYAAVEAWKHNMQALQTATGLYLYHREITQRSTSAVDGDRLRAAKLVARFANSQLELLDSCQTDPMLEAQDPRRDLPTKELQRMQDKQMTYLHAAKNLTPASRAQVLAQQVAAAMNTPETAMLLQAKDTLTPQQQEYARDLMAKMCASAMVIIERGGNPKAAPGPIEQALNNEKSAGSFVDGIKSTLIFQKMTDQITPTSLRGFMKDKGEVTFTSQMAKLAQASKEQEQKLASFRKAPVQQAAVRNEDPAKAAPVQKSPKM